MTEVNNNCTQADHEAMKADPERWKSETVAPPGHGARPPWGRCELANCRRCNTTLMRPVDARPLQVLPPGAVSWGE